MLDLEVYKRRLRENRYERDAEPDIASGSFLAFDAIENRYHKYLPHACFRGLQS